MKAERNQGTNGTDSRSVAAAPERTAERTLRALLTAALLCLTSAFAHAYPSYEIALPNGEYIETTEDLKVKAIGGFITAKRVWTNSRWYLNPEWTDLKFHYDSLDGSVKAIDRGGAIYERSGDTWLLEKNYHLKKDGSGYRWGRQDGTWATYDSQGRITASGDRNTTHATFEYNGTGQRTAVKDAKGNLALTFTYNSDGLLQTIEDRTGRKVTYTYTGNRLTKITDVMGFDWTYTYNSYGQIETRTDPEGNQIQLFYIDNNPAGPPDGTGFKAVVPQQPNTTGVVSTGKTIRDVKTAKVGTYTDAEGNVTTYQYQYNRTSRQYTATRISPEGVKQTTVYDKDGRVLQSQTGSLKTRTVTREGDNVEAIADARGNITRITYDGNRNILKTTYPDGSNTQTTWNSYNQPLTQTDELGTVTEYQYDAKGNLTKKIEAKGYPEQRTTEYQYDSYGQRTKTTLKGATEADDIVTQWKYDDYGNVTEETNAENYTTKYAYDVMGNVTVRTDALNNDWKTEYDAQGNIKSKTTPLGNKTSYIYDKIDNLVKETDSLGNEITYSYDKNSRRLAVPVSGGKTVLVSYSKDGLLKSIKDADGVINTYEYNAFWRTAQLIEARGITIYEYGTEIDGLNGLLKAVNYPTYREEYKYDSRNRIVQTIQILAKPGTQTEATERIVMQQEYDAKGQVAASTDNQNRVTKNTYDKLGRIVAIADSLNGVTRYSYDKQDNLLTVTDAKSSTTTYVYDKLGETVKEVRPMGEEMHYTYDALGQIRVRTDSIGNETRHGYNEDGLRTTQTYFVFTNGALSSTPSQSISYQYNAKGELVGYQQTGDTESSAVYEYDADGNRTSETVAYGSGAGKFSKTLKQTYTLAGRKKSHVYPDGTEVAYTYNANGQLESAVLPDGQIRWESYQWQQPTKIVLPGIVRTQEHDPLQRPTRLKSQQIGAGTQESPAGDIIMDYRYQYDKAGNITQRQTEQGMWQYGYDNLDRLTQAVPPETLQRTESNPNGLPVEGYTYDAVHNRTTSQHQPGTWNYNQNHQLLSFGTEDNKTTYTYNALGHTEQETTIQSNVTTKQRTYLYNAAERLTEVKDGNQTIAKYQYDPFGRRISKTVNGETIWFQYSDEGLIAEYNNQTLTKLYGWQPQGLWGSEPLWQAAVSGAQKATRYYHADNLGTSQRLTDKDGNQTWTMQSEAFGKTTIPATAAVDNNLRFPGQYYDEETALHYNYFRDYSPTVGRYVESDPIGLEGGVNIFVYVRSSPLDKIDEKGLKGSDPRLPCLNPKRCSPITPDQYYCAKAVGNCREACLACCALLQLRGHVAQGPCNVECNSIVAGCGDSCPPTNFYGDSCCL